LLQNSGKNKMSRNDILELVSQVKEIYSVKGKKVNYLNLSKEVANQDTILSLLLGPTGNLRAPTLRIGSTLVVGFQQDIYNQIFDLEIL